MAVQNWLIAKSEILTVRGGKRGAITRQEPAGLISFTLVRQAIKMIATTICARPEPSVVISW